jgi:tetratricopeptide (TPR) repeat protein
VLARAGAHRSGALSEAVSDLTTAVELAAEHSSGATVVTDALLAEALLDQGEVGRAEQAMAAIAPPDELPDYIGWNYYLHARAAIHAAHLNFRAAIEDFLACGVRHQRWGAPNPSVIAWRSHAALAYLALGEHRRAVELAAEELRLARRFGAPRAIGIALRTLAVCERGERQLPLLREAVSVLERSQARLEHARALADLGSALRRANERATARGPLRQASARDPLRRDTAGSTSPQRAAGDRRATTNADPHRRRRAHPDRATSSNPGSAGNVQPANRTGAVHLAQDRREASRRGLPQTRHTLTRSARGRACDTQRSAHPRRPPGHERGRPTGALKITASPEASGLSAKL